MPQPTGTVMDAVNAALAGEVHEEPALEDESESADGVDDAASDGGEEEVADEGDEAPEGDEAAGEGEGEEAPEGVSNRRADGTFKSKEEIAAEVAAKAAGGEKPGAAKPGAKQPDPLNDPIPKEVAQQTQDRIRALIKMTRDETAAKQVIETDFNYIVQGIQATGASPEQYGETLSWLSMFNSNDPAQQAQALELVESVADRLATMLGRERQVSDPIAKHQDLAAEVQQGKITKERALEIARSRNSQAFQTEMRTTAQTHQQTEQQKAQELEQAKADLNDLEQTLQAADPQYARKKAILVQKLKPEFAKLPPSQWAAKFRAEYRTVKLAAPAAARRPGVPANQPMRARGGGAAAGGSAGGTMSAQPKSMRGALDEALAKMGV